MGNDRIMQIGTRAAYKAGQILKEHFGSRLEITKKGAIDLVTQADVAAEQAIIATIRETFHDHAVLAEESGLNAGASDHLWIIDPLDGTTNFAHGLPLFAVSIAFAHQGDVIMGLVLNPVSGEFYSAIKGRGALLNSRPIQVSATRKVNDCLLVTGFPYDILKKSDMAISRFEQCLKASQGVRRLGSAALDLCLVAAGCFDGFWEEQLKPWDVAAGILIATEAGGFVSDFSGRAYRPTLVPPGEHYHDELLATNSVIHDDLVALMIVKDHS